MAAAGLLRCISRRVWRSDADVRSIMTGNVRFFFKVFFFEFSAVPSMPQGFQQFPTTGDDIEEPSCSRPRPRAALSASIAGSAPMPFPMSITVAIAARLPCASLHGLDAAS